MVPATASHKSGPDLCEAVCVCVCVCVSVQVCKCEHARVNAFGEL